MAVFVNLWAGDDDELKRHMVVDTYDGSLKAEHGTGRNMAPFDNPERLEALEKGYRYLGEQTCAADSRPPPAASKGFTFIRPLCP
jgi:hypothetical protein